MKLLRFRHIRDVTPTGLDGHMYRVQFEIGKRSGDEFKIEATHEFDVGVSRTLQTIWSMSDTEIEQSSASAAMTYAIALAAGDRLHNIPPLLLNTFTAPKAPPGEPAAFPGATYPIHLFAEASSIETELSFLSLDISKIRDEINALTSNLWGGRLLLLSQERALFDMYKRARSEEEFRGRIQSLAGIATDLNNKLLEKVTDMTLGENTGNLTLLTLALEKIATSTEAKEVIEVLRNINFLRQGYPAHGDAAKKHLDAHVYFGLIYPISDFTDAWEKVLARYFGAMKKMRDLLSKAWAKDHGQE